ncbi:FAD:protein FMN transferase [Psychromarinibacter sp. C21-152]|uniref:FAD:protein FMN transferase n=1 Tax=Psychromarinibacter sediminicola TaxID=3033385 RepID=A0AAE3NWV6_9RHOB|nr:FAD:protein FMN transferase [Psychromarinibacter sediminicola]MDF0602430.1 FAD:protein FMN transferase [Psychromarinibacter sediminicola]
MTLTRRRFFTIASAACLAAPAAQAFRWQGTALGARAQIVLDHPEAARITRAAMAEIDRLEDIFSLYRPASELSRLNAAGRLAAPSFEMLDCLATARRVHGATGGAFDPTVQPLWQVLAEAHAQGHAPVPADLTQARAAIGFDRVVFDSAAVRLGPGQRLTLNGIAQGYIADRVARLMRAEGVADVLIDTGEILALGGPQEAEGWPVTIQGERQPRALSGRALATSAPLGTVLDDAGRIGHILDPRKGAAVRPTIRQISVSAPSAALADALSTGLCLARGGAEARRLLSKVKEARLESLYPLSET